MMYNNSDNELFGSVYENNMNALRMLCARQRKLINSDVYQNGLTVKRIKNLIKKNGMIKGLALSASMKIRNKHDLNTLRKKVGIFNRQQMELSEPNYFSDERIAVYTCIFGGYDRPMEPICRPDNIDYYIITDGETPADSAWRKVDLEPFAEKLAGKTPVEKNRWFKMHPSAVFKNYQYSIYIDGNVVPVTDFTEFANRIGRCGVAMFWHSRNNCVYQEALYNRYMVKKINDDELQEHVRYLRAQGMPENYGMTTCNVIVRDHTNPMCAKLMDDWWSEFMTHCRRDQMSFPYVVWKNGVEMSDIARLGNDVWNTDTLLIVRHTD